MKLEIKSIDCLDFDLSNFPSKQIDDFYTVIIIGIGFAETISADNFNVYLYTNKWLDRCLSSPVLKKNAMIIKKFDLYEFTVAIQWILDECNEMPFQSEDLALKNVARYFQWEFENYQF